MFVLDTHGVSAIRKIRSGTANVMELELGVLRDWLENEVVAGSSEVGDRT